jgi:hypothetical protein
MLGIVLYCAELAPEIVNETVTELPTGKVLVPECFKIMKRFPSITILLNFLELKSFSMVTPLELKAKEMEISEMGMH